MRISREASKREFTEEIRNAMYALYLAGNPRSLIERHFGFTLQATINKRGKRERLPPESIPLREKRLTGITPYRHLIVERYQNLYR